MHGLLIAIEGIDGSGKSTLAHTLNTSLQQYTFSTLLTGEPGKTPLGEKIKEIVLFAHGKLSSKAEFLLFAANRAQHIKDVVKPALATGKIVISDRLDDSSLAYQGYGRNLNIAMLSSINQWAMDDITPDLTLYIRIDLDTAFRRIKKRNTRLCTFEKEPRAFGERVIKGFDTMYTTKANVVILDGTLSPETIASQAFDAVIKLINTQKQHV